MTHAHEKAAPHYIRWAKQFSRLSTSTELTPGARAACAARAAEYRRLATEQQEPINPALGFTFSLG